MSAWSAFQQFVRAPLDGVVTVTVGIELSQAGDRDGILWMSFLRNVEEPDGSGWSVGCSLSRRTPPELADVQESRWWWAEHGTIEQWISEVEAMPVFAACVALDGWRWEGFSD